MGEPSFVTIGTARIAYSVQGSGPPLLFLHGTGATPLTYQPMLAALAEEYTVYAPDLPGHGRSTAPEDGWTMREYAELFTGFITTIIKTPCLVVGHSFGGTVAITLASYQGPITEAVLLNPAIPPVPYPFWYQTYAFCVKKSVTELFAQRDQPTIRQMGQEFMGNVIRNGAALPALVRTMRNAFYATDIPYATITVPVTILWGKDDAVFPVSYAYTIERTIPQARLKIVDGPHSWALFRPRYFMKVFRTSRSAPEDSRVSPDTAP